MGSIIVYFIIPIIVWVIFLAAKKEVKTAEKSMDLEHFVITQSKLFLVVGIICAVFFLALLILMTIFPNDTAEWWVYLVFSLFVLLGLSLTFYCATWKIEIDENQIQYSPFPWVKRQFLFTDITKVKNQNQQQIKVYSADKIILKVDWNCRGFNVFKERLEKEQILFED
jgi:hypothetical protein